ncbi:MAG: DUF4338 domain-containing protein [Planctomycetes bacterium]|nr:DUF4338 domain-containing protein [Planctomycetota bacterium]
MRGRLVYKGRQITSEDITFIKEIITAYSEKSRRFISQEICRAWKWAQHNGQLKDMLCRGLLLHLERQGYIKLPPKKCNPNNPFINRKRPEKVEIDKSPIEGKLSEIGPIELKQVGRTKSEKIFNGLISEYHYLGYSHPVGEHLKFTAFACGRAVGCMAWSSAPWHIKARDKFIGWSAEARKKNLHLIAYNTRFLVLPWVRVKFLSSHLLGLMARNISHYWQKTYNHPIFYLETFVDKERFKGISYQAANWLYLGDTTGRGKNDQTNRQNRSIKAVYGYPLMKKFREVLCR